MRGASATATAGSPLFLVKAASGAPARFAILPLASGEPREGVPAFAKFSLRLTAERRARMKEAAARVGQSCQAFLVDALDAHIERVPRDTGGEVLRFVRADPQGES